MFAACVLWSPNGVDSNEIVPCVVVNLVLDCLPRLYFCDGIIEPGHQISNNVVCVTSKASDQHAHMRSLIGTFASRLNILGMLSF